MSPNLLTKNFLSLSRASKRLVVLCVDIVLCIVTVWFAFYLRLGEWVGITGSGDFSGTMTLEWRPLLALVPAICISIPIFISAGLYRAIFRYSGLPVLMTLMKAASLYGAIYAFIFTVIGFQGVPRTVGLIQPLLLLLAVGASRVFASFWFGNFYSAQLLRAEFTRVLIYGASSTGRELANALINSNQMKVLGFLEDDPHLVGNALNGKRIYHSSDLPNLIQKLKVTDVLLALPSINRKRRNEIISFVQSYKVHVRTLPNVTDLAKGRVTVSDIHDLDIEDLLGRDAVTPDEGLLRKNIAGKVVMVTGAGGSIGSELCRQIIRQCPATLVLLEQGEFNLYRIHQELSQTLANVDESKIQLIPVLTSVRDEKRMREVVSKWKPQTIYHAAAYKHVPLVESNPIEGIQNNVFGTLVVAKIAIALEVENFILISTDKAVRPTNVMGASKRLAEMILQALANNLELAPLNRRTVFSMVRFGNVLDSSGSVVPKFKDQIQSGGPITLTHPEVTRYFMTIPEAAELVIQASAMANGGEVFLLDMGQPIKIMDLACRMIELSGLTVCDEANPDGDIEIELIGLRPGEKLYEELLIGDSSQETKNPRIMMAHENFVFWPILTNRLDELKMSCDLGDLELIDNLLRQLVSGYKPDCV